MDTDRPRPAGRRRAQPIRNEWRRPKAPCLWIWIVGLLVIAVAARVALSLFLISGIVFKIPTSASPERPLTHYEVLNITLDAAETDRQIQSAYRRQLKTIHPDKVRGGGDETTTGRLVRLQTARDVLKPHTRSRCAYDYWDMRLLSAEQFRTCTTRAQARMDQERRETRERRRAEEREAREEEEKEKARRENPPRFGDVVGGCTVVDFFAEARARAKAWAADHADRAAKALGATPPVRRFVVQNKWWIGLGGLGSAALLAAAWVLGS
ncbi:hypothetical protein SLS62_010581 [Diatrype stigma]|uniref:J domain-containing protein n=1 Tax=Diatrype stigma TaxID=117547 RepID=A0AAN9YG14_9PEZI